MAIKGQAITDFIVEFTYSDAIEVAGTIVNVEATKGVETGKGKTPATESKNSDKDSEQWTLYMDSSSNKNGSGVDMMLISPEGHKIHCALCFRFQASKNKVEYEAIIEGFQLASELWVRNLKVYSDSQLVVNQVNDFYQEEGKKWLPT